jgi:hypothetical protein
MTVAILQRRAGWPILALVFRDRPVILGCCVRMISESNACRVTNMESFESRNGQYLPQMARLGFCNRWYAKHLPNGCHNRGASFDPLNRVFRFSGRSGQNRKSSARHDFGHGKRRGFEGPPDNTRRIARNSTPLSSSGRNRGTILADRNGEPRRHQRHKGTGNLRRPRVTVTGLGGCNLWRRNTGLETKPGWYDPGLKIFTLCPSCLRGSPTV